MSVALAIVLFQDNVSAQRWLDRGGASTGSFVRIMSLVGMFTFRERASWSRSRQKK